MAGLGSIAALEAGWITTEVGRQPWIAYKLMRVEDAVTTNGGLWWTYGLLVALYAGLGTATVLVIRRMARQWRRDDEEAAPVEDLVGVGT